MSRVNHVEKALDQKQIIENKVFDQAHTLNVI